MIEMFRYLIGILEKRERRQCTILVVLNFLSPILDIFSFSTIIFIINIVIREQHVSERTVAFTFFMGIVSIMKGFFDLWKSKVHNQFLYDGSQNLSVKLYEVLLKENLLQHNQKNHVQAITLVRNDSQNCMIIVASMIEILANLLMMIGYCAVMVYISRWIGVMSCIAIMILMFVVFFYHHRQIKLYGEKSRGYSIKTSAQVTIAYGCFKEMKIADKAEAILHKYNDASMQYAQTQKEYQHNRSVISIIMKNFVMAAVFGVLTCILLGADQNIVFMLASMIMYFVILARMIPVANTILNGLNNIEFSAKSYEVVKKELIEYEKIRKTEEQSKKIRRKELSFRNGLYVKNLNFGYNDQVQIFKDASIEIPAGCSIAVIGTSGIGKTTFLDLILGLLAPQSGEIRYDDYDIVAHIDSQGECRAAIGDIVSYIPQTVYLNGETIRNNVVFFQDDKISDEPKVIASLKCAQVWDDVMRMPEGLDTLIGENGTEISGGQRQRIALARALYKDFELLIMDEATAALDMETEKAVIDSIQQIKKDKTILLATHHMNLAYECDIIYRIENQKFVKIK